MQTLQLNEDQLVGSWKQIDGKVVADETCQRIQRLVSQVFEKIGADSTGWKRLDCDSRNRNLWRLTYPHRWGSDRPANHSQSRAGHWL